MSLLTEKQYFLQETASEARMRFPNLFDDRLTQSFYQLLAHTDQTFLEQRSTSHLVRLIFAQFFLRRKLETLEEKDDREVFVRIFSSASRICVAVILSYKRQFEIFHDQHILKAIQTFVPGVKEIPDSFFTWQSSKDSYLFCYLELQKLRGRDLTTKDLKELQENVQNYIYHEVTSCCPPIFWPYNHEESYRQILTLKQEIHHSYDLPQISIHFKEQTTSDLEFLIHLARPKSEHALATQRLPPSVHFSSHLRTEFNTSEAFIFSLHIPSDFLHTNKAVNLLNARRYIVILLQEMIGPFRDFNSGLFTKQEDFFGQLKVALYQKIPDFALFAEKVFYSLKPIEKQSSLTIEEAEALFNTVLEARQDRSPFSVKYHPLGIVIIKATQRGDLERIQARVKSVSAHFSTFNSHYLCFLDQTKEHFREISKICSLLSSPEKLNKALRLNFTEGPPPSLSPLFLNSDIRCRCLSKLLFEGLIRFDRTGEPILAGASEIFCSQDGLCYTIKIRPHHWSNGEPVTAFQYAETWRHTLLTSHSAYSEPFFVIKNAQKGINVGIHALNDQTLKVELESPDPAFLKKLAQPIFLPDFEPSQEPKWFNGPYQIRSNDPSSLILERNPYFWEKERLYFDQINISMVRDPYASFALFEKGELDWIGNPISDIPCDMRSKVKDLKIQPTNRFFWLYLNTHIPLLSSPLVRQALSLVLDRKLICDEILIDETPMYTPLPEVWAHADPIVENVAQAKQLFHEGTKELKPIPPLVISYAPEAGGSQLAAYFKSCWEKAFGIKIELEESEWNAFRSRMEKGEFQIGGCWGTPYYDDPMSLLERFQHLSICNFSRWSHSEYRKKIELARISPSPQLLKDLETILLHEVPMIPVSHHPHFYAHRSAIKGFYFDRFGCVEFRDAYKIEKSHEQIQTPVYSLDL